MNRNKCKATWDIIRDSKCNIPDSEIHNLTVNGKLVNDASSIANSFNDFFIDNINSELPHSTPSSLDTQLNSMYVYPILPGDVLKLILNLKNTKSTGYDDICTSILKHVALKISPVLSHIINLCFTHGVFPDKLKVTIIKPLFKKGDRLSVNCYRPIALIPVFSKVFEKAIHDNIYNYFDKNNLFADEQSGFRKNKSIDMAVYNFLNEVMRNLNNKNHACALYMDLTKAFDNVDHNILLSKLSAYGVRGSDYDLIKSYLSNRRQSTQITRICAKTKREIIYSSKYREVKIGVPQGSVLGPLLFIIYVNDLPRITSHPTVLFADDATVVFSGKELSKLKEEVENTLLTIIEWLTSNKLKINLTKTKIMTFKNRNGKQTDVDVYFQGQKIEQINTTKFLGLHIDYNLNWKSHLESLCLKLSQQSYALYMLAKTVSTSAVLASYHGYVGSLLRYGIMFWGYSTEKEAVFKMQKRCIRAICSLKPTDSCKPFFQSLKILTLPCLYVYWKS